MSKKIKNQPKKNQPQYRQKKSAVVGSVVPPVPRRNRAYRKKVQRKKGIENVLITPVDRLVMASGVLKTINVQVPMDQPSFNFIPTGLVSRALTLDSTSPYAIFYAIYLDLFAIISNSEPAVTGRLNFANHIYGALSPKTVPFRNFGSLGYTITGISNVPPGPSLPVDGGYNYYMYDFSNNLLGPWLTQVAPSAPTMEEMTVAYNNAMTNIAGKLAHNSFVRDIKLQPDYLRDISAFAQNSKYFGQGGGVAGPYGTIEAEAPFRSRILGTLVPFAASNPRVSRVIDVTTGDSCSNWSIGCLDLFPTINYQGAIPPVYKFLDLSEVVMSVILQMVQAVTSFLATSNQGSDILTMFQDGLGCTYTQFFIMVRQQVLWMFADSQNLGQFLTPEVGNSTFQSFLCGSNCFPQNPVTLMLISQVLNENLRGLKICQRPYQTKNFQSKKNHILHIPVWGAFQEFATFNPFIEIGGSDYPLFSPDSSDPNVPSVFDGTSGNSVVDFNNTILMGDIVATWNDWMTTTNNMWSSVVPIGGDANGSPFLQFTRYVQFTNFDQMEIKTVPRAHRFKRFLKQVEIVSEKRSSKEMKKQFKTVMVVPNSSVFSENTLLYSGMIPITQTHKEYLPHLILPVIEIQTIPNALPSRVQIQVADMEPFSTIMNKSTVNPFTTRGSEIIDSVPDSVLGQAGKRSEFAKYVETLSVHNQGGFLGDLFSAVAQGANALGIAPVGEIAGVVGGVANMIGI